MFVNDCTLDAYIIQQPLLSVSLRKIVMYSTILISATQLNVIPKIRANHDFTGKQQIDLVITTENSPQHVQERTK